MELTEEQKKRVESVFHEALNTPRADREEFLAQACSDDESVYQEAASLLRHYESASDLRELGAPRDGPERDLPLPVRIGIYEVLGRLGHGGMGEVYLARDPRLGRKVAIKVLSPAIAGAPGAMERLRREALAASALNHPNILTVYEFGESEETRYIVSEYVEGTSLRELIGGISPEKAVDYARQIGEALSAAHKAGIIHRDIKPENIMVRADGYVKVLDFGLAKAVALQGAGTTSIQEKLAHGRTATMPGMLLGTISYMAPEQVRGQEVDQRTDIWSWGVVLYEMLTGKKPFEGETPSDVMAGILSAAPHALPRKGNIRRILCRALAKTVDERYQDFGEALENMATVEAGTGSPIRFVPARPSLQRLWVVGVFLLCLAGAAWYLSWNARGESVRLQNMAWLTTSGSVAKAAISPEGDYVAYVTADGNKQALRLKQLSTSAETEKLRPADGEFTGLTISGGFIYYVLQQKSIGRLFRVSLLGDDARLIAIDVDSPISFAPDSKRFVFLRVKGSTMLTSLVIKELDTGSETVLAKLESHEHFWSAPLWSADGKFVVSEVYDDAQGDMKLMSVRASDGQRKMIPVGPWSFLRKPAWLRRGTLVVAAAGPHMMRTHLVEVTLADGRTNEIGGGLADYADVDTTPQGQRLVAVEQQRFSSVWLVDLKSTSKARQLTAAGSRYYGLAWSKDGTLFSQSETNGRSDLVAIDVQHGNAKSLTDDDYVKIFPEVTRDGKYLIYSSNRDGTFHLWRSDLNGRNAVRLTADPYGEEEGVPTPDSKWAIFTSLHNGSRTLWKVPLEGGAAVPVTDHRSAKPSVSPDGTLIACEYLDQRTNATKIAILREKDGSLLRIFDQIPVLTGARIRWSADGKSLLYVSNENGIGNVWAQPVDGGKPKQITHFQEDEIFYIAVASDGKSVACLRGRRISDAVLARIQTD